MKHDHQMLKMKKFCDSRTSAHNTTERGISGGRQSVTRSGTDDLHIKCRKMKVQQDIMLKANDQEILPGGGRV